MTALKKKSEGKHRYPTVRTEETCKQQLRRMCKEIAEDITAGREDVHRWMEGVYTIDWITTQDHRYKNAQLLVAGGGPNIWVNTQTKTVDGYWWGDTCKVPFEDNIGLDEHLEELHASK